MRHVLYFPLLPPANEVCKGYVFTHVCHSVQRGVGWYPSMICRWYSSMPCSQSPRWISPHALQVSRPTSKEEVEGSGWGGGGHQAHTRDGVGVSALGACSGGGLLVEAPRDHYCCGWYASYWNAFLFLLFVQLTDNFKQLLKYSFHPRISHRAPAL